VLSFVQQHRRNFLPYLLWSVAVGLIGLCDAQDCGASVPCKMGCCSKFGFCGLGPNCKTRLTLAGPSLIVELVRKLTDMYEHHRLRPHHLRQQLRPKGRL